MTDDLCFCDNVVVASKDGNEAKSRDFKEFDDVISEFMKDQGIPGLALTVSYHGNVIYSQGRPRACTSKL